MIELNNIGVKYDKQTILNKTNIKIYNQAITLFQGESGSGKTSLLYRICLISEDHDFQYKYNGKLITNEKDRCLLRKNEISFVTQDDYLFEQYDVLGNLKLYSQFNNKDYTLQDYQNILKSVNLDISFDKSIQTLSGGQKQRLAIACALCKDTKIIILDEPTSNLDKDNEDIIFNILKNLVKEYNKTIIISSHSKDASKIADTVYKIENKELKEIINTNKEDIQTNIHNSKLSFNFYLSYIKYFFKRYFIYEIGLLLVMTVSLLLINVLTVNVNKETNNSIKSFQNISENQMFVTKNKDNTTIDSLLKPFELKKIDNTTIYPYVPIQAMIGDYLYQVVPLYNQNDLSNQILSNYDNNKIYLSYNGYLDYMYDVVKPKDLKISFIVNDDIIETNYKLGGILKKNNECHYFKGEKRYLYCDYNILKEYYNQSSCLGYTVFTKDYDSYIEVYHSLDNYGVNLFFDKFNEIDNLKKISKRTNILIVVIGFVIMSVIFLVIEYYSLKRRNDELVMLKLNGINNFNINILSLIETILKISLALIINIILFKQNIILSLSVSCGLLILSTIYQIINTKKLSFEKILRNNN